MAKTLFWFLSLIINGALSQFPTHMDFKKMGEIVFKNEKYNVLKPSVHIVRDHFADTMMRRETTDFPTKKVMIDESGFRHYWGEIRNVKSGRRDLDVADTEIKENVEEVAPENETKTPVDNTDNIEAPATNDDNTEAAATDKVVAETKAIPTVTRRKWMNRKKKWNGIKVQHYALRADKKIQPKLKAAPATPPTKKNLTLVKTTYFCPYIGIITTHNYIED